MTGPTRRPPPLDWQADGQDWPHRDTSRFVVSGAITWRVQQAGSGPVALLLHGTGASAHSFHDLFPDLARRFTLIAPDLPGHAFSQALPAQLATIGGIAAALATLMKTMGHDPALIIGHSAGAAIALELAQRFGPGVAVIGINPALLPFPGLAARIFPPMARFLFANPLVPALFAGRMRIPGEAERFIAAATHSRIGPISQRCYARLLGHRQHCAGALQMMAHWDLGQFRHTLGAMHRPVLLIHADNDPAIPAAAAHEAAGLLPDCTLVNIAGAGHLAHEARPCETLAAMIGFLRAQGIAGPRAAEAAEPGGS